MKIIFFKPSKVVKLGSAQFAFSEILARSALAHFAKNLAASTADEHLSATAFL
jgi:hypothetical protein